MKKYLLLIFLLIFCASCSKSVTTEHSGKSVNNKLSARPGYVVQELEFLGGAILKPEGWHYCPHYEQGTLAFMISKEDCAGGPAFATGMTINVVPGVKTKSGATPSEYAGYFMAEKAKVAEVLLSEKPQDITMPDMTGKFIRNGLLVMEEKYNNGKKVLFQIGYTLFAHDEADLLVIMIFGTPASEWGDNYETYKTMTDEITLFDKDVLERNIKTGYKFK